VVTIATITINVLATIALFATMEFVQSEQIVEDLALSTATATALQTVSTVFLERASTT